MISSVGTGGIGQGQQELTTVGSPKYKINLFSTGILEWNTSYWQLRQLWGQTKRCSTPPDFKAYQSMKALWEQSTWLAMKGEEFVNHLSKLKKLNIINCISACSIRIETNILSLTKKIYSPYIEYSGHWCYICLFPVKYPSPISFSLSREIWVHFLMNIILPKQIWNIQAFRVKHVKPKHFFVNFQNWQLSEGGKFK